MKRDPIDELRYRAEQTTARLFVLAGVSTGLILTVGLLFLQDGHLRGALALAVLALVVGGFMLIAAQHIRFSALSLFEVGSDLRAEALTLRRRQGEVLERLAHLRTRDHGVERALNDLRARVRELEAATLTGRPLVDVPTVEPDAPTADTPWPIPAGAAVTSDLAVTQRLDPPS